MLIYLGFIILAVLFIIGLVVAVLPSAVIRDIENKFLKGKPPSAD
jgi:hypothetical protein